MKIIKPYYVIEDKVDGLEVLRKIEKAGRTCYKSESKLTDDSAAEFVRKILKRGHESVIEHEKVTVRIICDRGVSHEIVRHRIGSYSQESTRYCDYSGGHLTFILPPWVSDQYLGVFSTGVPYDFKADGTWFRTMLELENRYKELRAMKWAPQQARSVLPNSLKTEIVCTFNLRQWRHFFKLRVPRSAHEQMREITIPLLKELKGKIPVIFDDIGEKE